MLARIKENAFDSEDWVFEIKYDGYRALALCDGKGNTELYSRNLLSFNADYAPIVAELNKMKHPCLIDGEVVVEDEKGRSHFQLLQNYRQQGVLKYYAFDILSLNDIDTTGLPLLKRKELLKLLLQERKLKNIFYSDHIAKTGIAFFEKAKKNKLEGIMAKKADSEYTPGIRTSEWLKIKIVNEQEAVIAGFTAPQGGRKHFGSIILGVYQKGIFKHIGHCGTGFDTKTLADLYKKFKPLFTGKSPFMERVPVNNTVQWLKPKLVCQVKFSEWTRDGSMRHPVFMGLRKDKSAREVVREKL